MYVNGDPVNLSDPTGHRYTTGVDSVDAGGSDACLTCSAYPTQNGPTPLPGEGRFRLALSLATDEANRAPSTVVPAPGPYVGNVDRLDADCAYQPDGGVVCPNYLGSYVLTLQQYQQEAGYAPGDPRPRSLADDVNQITIGFCVNTSVFGIVGVGGSACVVDTGLFHHFGVAGSGGLGFGLDASASVGIEVANAEQPLAQIVHSGGEGRPIRQVVSS